MKDDRFDTMAYSVGEGNGNGNGNANAYSLNI